MNQIQDKRIQLWTLNESDTTARQANTTVTLNDFDTAANTTVTLNDFDTAANTTVTLNDFDTAANTTVTLNDVEAQNNMKQYIYRSGKQVMRRTQPLTELIRNLP